MVLQVCLDDWKSVRIRFGVEYVAAVLITRMHMLYAGS